MWDQIVKRIQVITGKPFELTERTAVGGGSINQAYRISDRHQTYFVKLNQASKASMFEAEALGLKDLAASGSIRVPQCLDWGVIDNNSYILLEWISLSRDGGSWAEMGRQLADLHQQTHPQGFGWHQSNTIGETPQLNPWTQDWATFFVEHRIGYQLQLAQRRGGRFPQSQKLLEAIPKLLLGHSPEASLVHGDLWSGNAAFSTTGEPMIFDPATYYGDREVDLAMTELFGGFPRTFYEGYHATWPLNPGYENRKVLYNLYHILNHFNLFGGSYAAQAESTMRQVIAMV